MRDRRSRTLHRRRRRWVRWLGMGTALAILVAAAVSALHVRTQPASAADVVEFHAAHGASFVPSLSSSRPVFILALGSDARPGEPILRERADSIHIIGVNPARHRATILGFPRDSWVAIPGHGHNKINAAMEFGGPSLMVKTLENLTGIHIDYWLLTSFVGMNRLVDGIGGLTVDVPYAMHDGYSHASFHAGVQRLRGWQALALARNRHDTPNGDFSRSQNQGLLFLSALGQLQREFAGEPARLLRWVAVGWQNFHTDLGFQTLIDLGLAATQVQPRNVRNLVIPGTTGYVGTASVVFVSGRAYRMFSDMRRDGLIG